VILIAKPIQVSGEKKSLEKHRLAINGDQSFWSSKKGRSKKQFDVAEMAYKVKKPIYLSFFFTVVCERRRTLVVRVE